MILLIAIEESINWLIKAISHYIIEFSFITISTLQDCPREQSHFWVLCITNRRTNRALSVQRWHRATHQSGKGRDGWVGPPFTARGNKQWDVIQMVKKKVVSSDMFLMPKINDERRWWILETQLLAQKTWGLGCPGLWDSRLHSRLCRMSQAQSIMLGLDMPELIKYTLKLTEGRESF